VRNVAGRCERQRFGGVPGRDLVGLVEASPPEWIGAEFGAHAELKDAAAPRKPRRLGSITWQSGAASQRLAQGLVQTRSPAPPLIALIGLFGMVLGEHAVEIAKRATFCSSPRPRLSGRQTPPKGNANMTMKC
jgi:hypothetical protein